MTAEAVISCPRCLRQYAVSPEVNGKLGRCDACKAHFGITILEPALPGEAISLEHPIAPRFNFMYEATACMARNVSAMLKLAGEPVTVDTVMRFVKSLPRTTADLEDVAWRASYCNCAMREAHRRSFESVERSLWDGLIDYFVRHLTGRDGDALDMIIAAFTGVFSVEFETPPRKELAVIKKRGPMERFAGRMGW